MPEKEETVALPVSGQGRTRRRVFLVCPHSEAFSGQQFATNILHALLEEAGVSCRRLRMPVLDRAGAFWWSRLLYLCRYVVTGGRFLPVLLASHACVLINLGQTWTALLRDGIPLLALRALRPSLPIVVSLHGSWFQSWATTQKEHRLFRCLLRASDAVTVLGRRQAETLLGLGCRQSQVWHVDNTTDVPCLEESLVRRKHGEQGPCRVLFLANLIDSKGYAEFLEAMRLYLARPTHRPLEITLCGRLEWASYGGTRFASHEEAALFIEENLARIAAVAGSRVEWVKGASGAQRVALLHRAHLLVLPSRIEAQPVTLIEALASGAAIVTSRAGEIPGTVEDCAKMMEAISPEAIADAVGTFVEDGPLRLDYALRGRQLFLSRFAQPVHVARWLALLDALEEGRGGR